MHTGSCACTMSDGGGTGLKYSDGASREGGFIFFSLAVLGRSFYVPPCFAKLNEWIYAGMVMGGHFHVIHARRRCCPISRPASRRKLEIELLGASVYHFISMLLNVIANLMFFRENGRDNKQTR
jgi:hypothetical protein